MRIADTVKTSLQNDTKKSNKQKTDYPFEHCRRKRFATSVMQMFDMLNGSKEDFGREKRASLFRGPLSDPRFPVTSSRAGSTSSSHPRWRRDSLSSRGSDVP